MKNKAGMTVYDIAKKESCRSTMTLLSAIGADDNKYLNCKQYPTIDQECEERNNFSILFDLTIELIPLN